MNDYKTCGGCGVVVNLDYVENTREDEQDRCSYSSDSYTYTHILWKCPVCKQVNDYNPEFDEVKE